jgi:MOB kinase activator 1
MLPKYVDIMEWVAVNSEYSRSVLSTHVLKRIAVYDFFTNLNEFYGCIAESCTAQSCPTMAAGPS